VIEKSNKDNPILFFADQISHFVVIYLAVLVYVKMGGRVPGYVNFCTEYGLLIVAGLLLCLKPANVLLNICLSRLNIIADKDDLPRVGHWIGSIERTMTFVLILLGQYTAIGFIIGAKSILRYSDKKNLEYVLVGTLMSFAVAFALGVGITSGFFENVIKIISCNI
jgi:hypothetical protein